MRGYTVEMSFLMPIILLLIMSSIYGVFYYHDKNIISCAAYETVVVGSNKAREDDGTDEEELRALFRERIEGKCIFLTNMETSVSVTDQLIDIQILASHKGMRTSIGKQAAVTEPEKKIRDIRRIKELVDGAKDYH